MAMLFCTVCTGSHPIKGETLLVSIQGGTLMRKCYCGGVDSVCTESSLIYDRIMSKEYRCVMLT